MQEKYPPLNFPLPPAGCENEAVKKLINSINEASAHLPGWKERAYASADEVPTYYTDEDAEAKRRKLRRLI